MFQQNAPQLLAFQLPLPGNQTGCYGWQSENRRKREIVISRLVKVFSVEPPSGQIQQHARYRKVNQHHVLGVPGQQHRPQIKRAGRDRHHLTTTLAVILGWMEQK
jgi:hypothetical protein